MSLSPGIRLGPYEILAPIGKGGMGEVYKARDTRLNRIVAVKLSKEQFSERFEREAKRSLASPARLRWLDSVYLAPQSGKISQCGWRGALGNNCDRKAGDRRPR
jgi:serine/threonine protein kinase